MPVFNFKAITPTGEVQSGTLDVATEAAAIAQLNSQGLIPVEVRKGNASGSSVDAKPVKVKRSLFGKAKMGQADVMAVTQQMSTMLKAGLPLDRALSILIDIGENPAVTDVLQKIQADVRGGSNFADALEGAGQFNRFYINMVRAGEAGGSIDDALARLVEYMQRAKELRATVISALIYPAILFSVAVISIIALLIFVVPQFAQMFNDMGAELPGITKVVMAAGDIFQEYWWGILIGIAVILLWVQFILTNEKARSTLDRTMLHWPLVGTLMGKIEMARFSRSLGTLLHNGVPLLGALGIVKNTMGNRVMATAVGKAVDDLKQGESLTQSLMEKKVFPSYALHMLRVGEETGRMEELLGEVAEIYDDEVKTSVKQLLALLEPMLILVMALSILVIIGAVLLPMVNMADLVQ